MLLALLLLLDPPADRRAALAHYAAGRLMAATDRPASAAKELEAAQKADPAAPEPKRELVRVYADLGRDAAAIRTARAVLAADPHDADTARRLGRLLFDGRQFADAAAALKQAADSPRLGAAERLAVLRECATAGEKAGDWVGAATTLKRVVALIADRQVELRKSLRFVTDAELDAEAAAVQEQLGAALAGGKEFAAAEAAYREAARLHAVGGDATRAATLGWNRAKVLAAAGRPADAVAAMDAFLALKPTTLPPYTDYANWLRAAGRGADAPARLARLADRHPGEPRIRWVQAAGTARQDPAAGATLFRPLLAASADPALAALFVQAFAAVGRADVIVAELNRRPAEDTPDPLAGDRLRSVTAAVKAEPGLAPKLLALAAAARGWPPETWELVGFLAERDGRPAEAEAALRAGLAAGDLDLFEPLYELLERQRKWKEMVALCREVDGLPPVPGAKRRGPPLLDSFLAVPLAELGREAEAVRAIDAAVGNAGRPFYVRLKKARVLSALGRQREAVVECEAVAADATDPTEVRAVRLARSQAYLGLRDFAASERELRAMLEDDPDDALALNNLGYHLADEGRDLAEAERLVRRAVEVDRAERVKAGSPEAERGTYLDSLGWVLFKRGDLAGAKAALERAAGSIDAAADPTVWDHLGDVRFRLGDAAGARAAWLRADAGYTDSHFGRQFGRQAEVRRKLKRVP